MTSKVYKTAQGKTVDLGTIMLQNEHVRAVGNMNVNARGDQLDSNNRVIETKNRQIQRQNSRTTTPATTVAEVHTSTGKAKRAQQQALLQAQEAQNNVEESVDDTELEDVTTVDEATDADTEVSATGGGLAAAIARSKIVKQEKEKTLRELAREANPGVRRI